MNHPRRQTCVHFPRCQSPHDVQSVNTSINDVIIFSDVIVVSDVTIYTVTVGAYLAVPFFATTSANNVNCSSENRCCAG